MTDLFDSTNQADSNWFKFNNVGDIIKGTLVKITQKEGVDPFPPQTVYSLTNASTGTCEIDDNDMPKNPDLKNVGDIFVASSKGFVNSRLSSCTPGDIIGLAFTKTIKSKKAGFQDAKSIIPFIGKEKDKDFIISNDLDANDLPF